MTGTGPILRTSSRVPVSCLRRGVPFPLVTKNSAVISLAPIVSMVEKVPFTCNGVVDAYRGGVFFVCVQLQIHTLCDSVLAIPRSSHQQCFLLHLNR